MIDTELDNMIKEVETRLSYQGMNMEMYLNMIGKTMADFRKEGEDQAKEAVKTRLVLEQIVKEEKIEPAEEKINEKLEELSKTYGKKAEELKENEYFMEYITKTLAQEQVISLLLENAKIK